MRWITLLFLLAVTPTSSAQECDNRALALAVIDARTILPEDRCYFRWVQIPDRLTWDKAQEKEAIQNLSHAINLLSLSPVMHQPRPLQGTEKVGGEEVRTVVCRIDLRKLCARDSQVHDKIKFWEEFRFDPTFNRLLTKDTLDFFETQKRHLRSDDDWVMIKSTDIDPKTGKAYGVYVEGGKTHTSYMVQKQARGHSVYESPVIRVVSPHIDKSLLAELIDYTHSQAPVVSLPYLIARSMRTIQDKDDGKDTVYSLIYGGLYYELSGTPRAGKKGTDEDSLLELLGVGNVDQGIRADDFFRRLLADPRRRTALNGSRVTGKDRQRLIEFLPTLVVRIGDGSSIYIATRDQKRSSIDIRKSVTQNLLDFKEDGSEIMYVRPNGLPGYAIANAQRKFVELVPENITFDSTKPPHSGASALEAPISCLSCHGPEYGWMNIPPDHVAKVLKSGRFNIFDDIAEKISREEALRRLTSLYAGDNLEGASGVLPTIRNLHAQAIMRATGPWEASKSKPMQLDIVKVSSAKLVDMFNDQVYNTIDAQRALAELGHRVKEKEDAKETAKEAQKLLRGLLPPLQTARIAIIGYAGYFTIIQEDERIISLLEGDSISRASWDLVRSFVASRIADHKRRSGK